MTLRKVLRFLVSVVIAAIVLAILLPLVGFPKSRLLPPPLIYNVATGKSMGYVINLYNAQSNDPFKVGEKMYFVNYAFRAVPPEQVNAPGKHTKQQYKNTVHLTGQVDIKPGTLLPVRYEVTNPGVSGLDIPGGGVGCAGASALLGPWLIYPIGSLLLGLVIMALINHFTSLDDI